MIAWFLPLIPVLLSLPHPCCAQLREGGKKDEKKRLKEFVEAADRLDPRVAKKKEGDRMERWAGVGKRGECEKVVSYVRWPRRRRRTG